MSLKSYCQIHSQINSALILDQLKLVEKNEFLIISADTLILGPNAELFIEGILEIQSPYIIFAPSAKVLGEGTIRITEPSLIPGGHYPQNMPTVIDGNWDSKLNSNIKVNIELNNTGNLILGKLTHNFLEGQNLDSDNFYCGGNFNLMEDGTCVELRGNRFALGEDAVLLNFSSNRMIITNDNINSVFSKKISAKSIFTFPVGIEEKDYSPITAKPEKDTELFVSLIRHSNRNKDFTFAEKDAGIGRIWGIHAHHRVQTTYIFEHNKEDEDERSNSSEMEIFQYSDENEWKLMATNYNLGGEKHSTKNWASMLSKVSENYFSKFGKVRNKPSSEDDYVSVNSGQSVMIPILKNDKAGDGEILVENTKFLVRPKNGIVDLTSSGEIWYQPASKFTGTDSLVYELVDENGFTSKSTVFITVNGSGVFLLSNVLTPNGDGYNDQLIFVNKGNIIGLQLAIVNRWGDRVYESNNYQNTWDGGNLGGGTYFYILKGQQENGDDFYQRGWVLLNK